MGHALQPRSRFYALIPLMASDSGALDDEAMSLSPQPAWITHLRTLVYDEALEALRQPLTLLFGAVAQHPGDIIPLTHHFIVSLRPELGSPVLERLAMAVTLFLVEADEDIDFSRYRETFWYFAWLKDFVRYAPIETKRPIPLLLLILIQGIPLTMASET